MTCAFFGHKESPDSIKPLLEEEIRNGRQSEAKAGRPLSWVDCFDKANTETRHMIMARLIERVELADGYKIHIRFKISMDQFQGT